eukprot:TRINITY_DN44596_c0_g1_i2.p1 TRINITY_DN44596_c0_g1~~TRINITY_DN44596_c0_g1_i2.p1  ORF type:complete len:1459 (+),score=297.27 TRINITY_DN44596_c0_g1_i2:49-4425(+)
MPSLSERLREKPSDRGDVVAQVQSCMLPLRLERIEAASWNALREANWATSPEIDDNIDHVSADAVGACIEALRLLQDAPAQVAAAVLEWLTAQPSRRQRSGLPRLNALLVLLAKACCDHPDLAAKAGALYLELLQVDGMTSHWSVFFQPALFRGILRAIRVLRRPDAHLLPEKPSGSQDAAEAAEVVEEEALAMVPEDALQLLEDLVSFLGQCSLPVASSSEGLQDVMALVLDELLALVSRPLDDATADAAAAGLKAIVAQSKQTQTGVGVRKSAALVMRGVLPVLLMNQERIGGYTAPPQFLKKARLTALALLCEVVKDHEELLVPLGPPCSSDDLDDAEPLQKRPRAAATGDAEASGAIVAISAEQVRGSQESAGLDDPIVALLQLICVSAPERADWRSAAVESVLLLLREASAAERRFADLASPSRESVAERFTAFLERILETERTALRVLATDLAASCLETEDGGGVVPAPLGADMQDALEVADIEAEAEATQEARAKLVRRLLDLLVQRCRDVVAAVRSRALSGVAAALRFLPRCGLAGERHCQQLLQDRDDPAFLDTAFMFRIFASDERAVVRKAALSFFDTMVPLLRSQLGIANSDALASFFDVRLVSGFAADEAVLVRKAAVSSLSLLLRTCGRPAGTLAPSLWAAGVLPLVLDAEASVAEASLKELETAILDPISEYGRGRGHDPEGRLELPCVLNRLDSESTEYLQRGLSKLAKRGGGKLPPRFVDGLARVARDALERRQQWPVAIWAMLEEVTCLEPSAVPLGFILDAWKTFSSRKGGSGPEVAGAKVLTCLSHLVHKAPDAELDTLMSTLCGALARFSAPTSLIRGMTAVIEDIEKTWRVRKVYQQRAQERASWKSAFLKSIYEVLNRFVSMDCGSDVIDSNHLCSCLFSLGELALLEPSLISGGVVLQVQTIATNTIRRKGEQVDTDAALRGHAFVTLGKFCLKQEELAKKSVELFVLHLDAAESLVVRSNVLVILGDLCVKYTLLVDRFLPYLTDLLRDSHELLRKQAAMVLASLMSEDFIKVKSSVFFRFLYCLSDPSPSIRGLVESVFARILYKRTPAMFSQNFLEVICFLNGWTGMAAFKNAAGNEAFSLRADPNRRAAIYRFMLSLMPGEQKYGVCAQIVTTLLAAFVDESEEQIDLPVTTSEPGGQVLSDGLRLLCCKEAAAAAEAGSQAQAGDEAAEAVAAARSKVLLSNVLKKTLCENILPVLLQLKQAMEARRSPFLGQLRYCLRELLRDFKEDLQEMLAGDVQLAAEIAYDLQEHPNEDHESIFDAKRKPPALAASAARPAPAPLQALQGLGPRRRRASIGSLMRTQSTQGSQALGLSPLPKASRSRIASPAASRSQAQSSTSVPGTAGTRQKTGAMAPLEVDLDDAPDSPVLVEEPMAKTRRPLREKQSVSPPVQKVRQTRVTKTARTEETSTAQGSHQTGKGLLSVLGRSKRA